GHQTTERHLLGLEGAPVGRRADARAQPVLARQELLSAWVDLPLQPYSRGTVRSARPQRPVIGRGIVVTIVELCARHPLPPRRTIRRSYRPRSPAGKLPSATRPGIQAILAPRLSY